MAVRPSRTYPAVYSIAEAKDRLPSLVRTAERGRAVELTRRGEPVAVIMSLADFRRLTGRGRDVWGFIQEYRRTTDLRALRMGPAYFAPLRDRFEDVAIETW